jgi:nucleotide-binding universal stress UspA family protein
MKTYKKPLNRLEKLAVKNRFPTRKGSAPAFKLKTILVPIDFSGLSKKSLAYALNLAGQFHSEIILLHVIQSLSYPAADVTYAYYMPDNGAMRKIKSDTEARLKQLVNNASKKRFIKKTMVLNGQPYEEIIDAAQRLKADLIVINTHGYSGFKRAFLGSTTERVVRSAPCPVLVVREKERDFVLES